jgi:AMMECR1 domain-containing protein
MDKVVRKVINTYLKEQKILSIEELSLSTSEYLNKKFCSFVTLYKDWNVIASSWRINLKKSNTILELIENALFCLKDDRFIEKVKTPDDIKDVYIRVDFISPEWRKVINNIKDIDNEIDIKKHWLILISQTLQKVSVILPNMVNIISTPKDLFTLVCKKASLNENDLKEEDYILYKIETIVFSDF